MELTEKATQELKALYEKLLPILTQLCRLEEKIAEIASKDAPEELTKLISESQPTVLAFRGLDKKREQLEKAYGITGIPLKELVSRFPAAQQAEMTALLDAVAEQLRAFKDRKESSERIMSVRLNDIDIRLAGREMPSMQDRRV